MRRPHIAKYTKRDVLKFSDNVMELINSHLLLCAFILLLLLIFDRPVACMYIIISSGIIAWLYYKHRNLYKNISHKIKTAWSNPINIEKRHKGYHFDSYIIAILIIIIIGLMILAAYIMISIFIIIIGIILTILGIGLAL